MKSVHFILATVLLIGLSVTVNSKPSTSLLQENFSNESIVLDPGAVPALATAAASTQKKAFISYRRAPSKHLAMLLKHLLTEKKIQAYLDVEDLKAGYWDTQLMNGIKESSNFIFILSETSLDRCADEKDVVHEEIKEAVNTKRNIILIYDDFKGSKVTSPEIKKLLDSKKRVNWDYKTPDQSLAKLIGYLD